MNPEKSLAAIFSHCREVQAGKRQPMPTRQAQEQVRLFLGLKRKSKKRF